MAEMQTLTIGEENDSLDPLSVLKPGMVIMTDHPRRVVRIEGMTTYDKTVMVKEDDQDVRTIIQKHGMTVTAVIPDRPIEGFVGPTELYQMKIARDAVLIAQDDYNDVQWIEVWGKRPVGKLINPERSAAARSDVDKVMQLFCVKQEGRNPSREATSPVVNRPVTGKVVPEGLVPEGLFKTDAELRAEAEEVKNRDAIRAEKAAEKQRAADHEQRLVEIQEMARARVKAEREYDAEHNDDALAKENAALKAQLADLAAEKQVERPLEPPTDELPSPPTTQPMQDEPEPE